ncbi:MAG TPA: hypothetical protein GXX29_09360 [Firmicutes bacterium]|nr:hypothetical protein [Bacillota bacterium]
MRVTHRMMTEGIKDTLVRRSSRLEDAHRRMSEVKRIFKPSDDPGALSRLLSLRSLLRETEDRRFQTRAALSVLAMADSALSEACEVMHKASDIAVTSGGTLNEEDLKNSLALQVKELIDQLNMTAATRYDDLYLFCQDANTKGAAGIFGFGMTKDGIFAPALAALEALYNELSAGRQASDGTIEALQEGLRNILAFRTQAGARTNRLEALEMRLITLEEDLIRRKSVEEEVDIALAMIDLREEEMVYQAALSATARVMQVSLVDYLR